LIRKSKNQNVIKVLAIIKEIVFIYHIQKNITVIVQILLKDRTVHLQIKYKYKLLGIMHTNSEKSSKAYKISNMNMST